MASGARCGAFDTAVVGDIGKRCWRVWPWPGPPLLTPSAASHARTPAPCTPTCTLPTRTQAGTTRLPGRPVTGMLWLL